MSKSQQFIQGSILTGLEKGYHEKLLHRIFEENIVINRLRNEIALSYEGKIYEIIMSQVK